jgi:divalent metal cation (Fe/Co/Zn/Cd) transporter
MFDFIENINWDIVAENLKSEHILQFLSSLDPVAFFSDPVTIVCSLIAIAIMFFFKMEKTFAIVVGVVILWIGMRYALPEANGEPLALSDVGTFAGVFMGVLGFWVYMFFIRD